MNNAAAPAPPPRRNTLAPLGIAAALGAVAVAAAARAPAAVPAVVDLTALGFVRRDRDTPAGRMAVFEAGSGPPLLFLHGIGGGASSFAWFRTAPAFTDAFRVVAPDFVGWGQSEHPSRPLLFDDYIAQVIALVADLGPGVPVVAQSLAAGFAAAVAAIRPGAIGRLAMLAPTGGRDFGDDGFTSLVGAGLARIARSAVAPAAYRAIFHRRAAIRSWYTTRGFVNAAAVPDAIVDAAWFSACQPGAEFSALPFVGGDLRFDIAPFLSRLEVPATMLWGADETIVRPATRHRLEALNPAIAVVTIPDARSNFELEQADATNAALAAFLDPA